MREGAVQVLKDPTNNLELTTEWLKIPGGNHGGSWAARISGKQLDLSEYVSFSLRHALICAPFSKAIPKLSDFLRWARGTRWS